MAEPAYTNQPIVNPAATSNPFTWGAAMATLPSYSALVASGQAGMPGLAPAGAGQGQSENDILNQRVFGPETTENIDIVGQTDTTTAPGTADTEATGENAPWENPAGHNEMSPPPPQEI